MGNHVWLVFSSCEFFYCVFKILGIILSLLIWDQQTISSSISSLVLGSLLYLGRGMETQDNGFLLVIDGVRKEKERLTATKKKKKKKKKKDWSSSFILSSLGQLRYSFG